MGVKLRSMAIVVDRPQPVYRPGEVVTGNCVIDLDGHMMLSQLVVKLKGEAECKWTEDYEETETDAEGHERKVKKERTIHSKHKCIDLMYCPGHFYPTDRIESGVHNIGFTFQLPPFNIPSSYEGAFGHIKYHLKAKIHKNQFFTIDEKRKLGITILTPAFASMEEMMKSVQNSDDKTIGCGCFGGKPLILKCQMQRTGHNIGTSIPISVFVDNQSSKSMTLKAKLKQHVVFHADGKTKKTENIVANAVGNNIGGNTKQNEVIQITVPNNIPVTTTICPIINIGYRIKVELDIPGSFDLDCGLPVILTNEQMPVD